MSWRWFLLQSLFLLMLISLHIISEAIKASWREVVVVYAEQLRCGLNPTHPVPTILEIFDRHTERHTAMLKLHDDGRRHIGGAVGKGGAGVRVCRPEWRRQQRRGGKACQDLHRLIHSSLPMPQHAVL